MCTGMEMMGFAGLAQGASGAMTANSEAGQYKTRAGQVLQSGMQEIDQAAYQQSRYRGEQKAAYGKSGVKMTGSAKTLTDEQLLQDEKTLLTMKYNTMLGVQDNLNAYKSKKGEATNALLTGAFKGGVSAYSSYSDNQDDGGFNLWRAGLGV